MMKVRLISDSEVEDQFRDLLGVCIVQLPAKHLGFIEPGARNTLRCSTATSRPYVRPLHAWSTRWIVSLNNAVWEFAGCV